MKKFSPSSVLIAFIVLFGWALDAAEIHLGNLDKAGVKLQNLDYEVEEDEMIPIYLVLRQQYCTDKLYREVYGLPKKQRREHTVNTLKEFSNTTQRDLRRLIEELEKQQQVTEAGYLWITNVIGMKATPEATKIFNEHPDVAMVEYDPEQYGLLESRENRTGNNRDIHNKYRNTAENVSHINAPQVWEDGYTGEGVIVSVLDSGVNYNHHDIRDQMWVHPDYPNHGYNFIRNNNDPLDDHSHGSHCAGTVAGDGTSGTATGIAPGSQIMALKVITSGGSGQEQIYWAGVQFSVENGADILSVSLGWRDAHNPNRSEFRRVMANALNAGVISANSAGNSGSAGLGTPGDCPPPWLHPDQTEIGGLSSVVAVGATHLNDNIAGFSSRGPVTWEDVDPYFDYPLNPGIGLINPDIVAPGVDVLSLTHDSDTGYTRMSGTSMSTPAVAGVMALMLSKNSELTPEKILKIIEETATPLSASKSNTYGSGLINAYEAVKASSFISVEEVVFTDDNNNIPEYGDTVNLTVTLLNQYVHERGNITGILSTDDEYVQIIEDTADYGIMEEDSTSTVHDAYTVQIADNIPDKHIVEFSLSINLNEELSWNETITMEVRAPHLISSELQIHDPLPGGNNNGVIDPGEELMLYIPIKNEGGTVSLPVNILVESESEHVIINNISDEAFAGLTPGETVYPFLSVSVSEEVEEGTMIRFSHSYESGNYIFEGSLRAFIGGMLPVQLGSGEEVTGPRITSPINIYFRTSRTQTVYTAEELHAAGIYSGFPIINLGYYVHSAPQVALPRFLVRMKHTQASDVSEHDEGPFETVYEADHYAPTSGDWDLLTLDTPFLWNGKDNILVDTAFSPAANHDASGQVRYYEVDNGFRFTRGDNLDQTNKETTSVSAYKPQIKMVFDISPGEEEDMPQNLDYELDGVHIILNWEAPQGTRQGYRRRNYYERHSSAILRNPDGYNIYRNGIRLNDEPIEATEYYDDDYDVNLNYYYYVTAVYEERESAASNIAEILFQVTKPQFSVTEEAHQEPFLLSLETSIQGAAIYYTLDGSEPADTDNLYDNPFEINHNTHVKAKAFKDGWQDSDSSEMKYYFLYKPQNLGGESLVNRVSLKWEQPLSSHGRREAEDNIKEKIRVSRAIEDERSTTRGRSYHAKIPQENNRYIRNEKYIKSASMISSDEVTGYNVYRSVNADSFLVANSKPLSDTVFVDRNLPSRKVAYYVTALYGEKESLPTDTVSLQAIADRPQFSHEPGEYENTVYLSLSTTTRGAAIYYTLDGTDPDESSLHFSSESPIEISATTTVKAIAIRNGWINSEVTEGHFINLSTDNDESIVYTTELLSAYPNPFNPQTVIEFTLKETEHVMIEVYNIAGQRVRTLIDDLIDSGRHRIVWKGEDNKGRRLSSGIYFYRMITTDYNEVKKLIMLK